MRLLLFQLTQSILFLASKVEAITDAGPCNSPECFGCCMSDHTKIARNSNVVPVTCDCPTSRSSFASRDAKSLYMIESNANEHHSGSAVADSNGVQYRILFRDQNPQIIDGISASDALGMLTAIIESVTKIKSDKLRFFSPNICEGAHESAEEGFKSLLELSSRRDSKPIDVLVISQHTKVNQLPVNKVSDEEANAREEEFRKTIIGNIIHRFAGSSVTNRILNYLIQMQIYEVPSHQLKALRCVPVMDLHKAAASASSSTTSPYEERLFIELLKWFKQTFFKWVNKPECSACGEGETCLVNHLARPNPQEVDGLAAWTEIYGCKACATLTRFPRLNHPVALLSSRKGRCGEWSNSFTLIARAMGFEMRRVYDSADHVWNEVWMDHRNEWVHCDPCEEAYDRPLLYETGWKKQATLTLAVSKESVADVTNRYTANPVPGRFDETLLQAINEVAINHWAGTDEQRMQYLLNRISVELDLLKNKNPEPTQQHHLPGRTSGSLEWRALRRELGTDLPITEQISEIFTGLVSQGISSLQRLFEGE